MLPRLVQRQLAAFAIVSVLAMSLLGVRYLEIPEGLGIGRFDVTVPISHASGLYPNAPVTYRGVQIGKVSDMRLSRAGTVATLSLADGSDVPASARVEVRNGSVIGEPFLNLVAAPGAGTDRSLRDGDRIPDDVSAVAIVHPVYDFTPQELEVLAEYWERPKSSLLVTLGSADTPPPGAGLETETIAMRPSAMSPAGTVSTAPAAIVVPPEPSNEPDVHSDSPCSVTSPSPLILPSSDSAAIAVGPSNMALPLSPMVSAASLASPETTRPVTSAIVSLLVSAAT